MAKRSSGLSFDSDPIRLLFPHKLTAINSFPDHRSTTWRPMEAATATGNVNTSSSSPPPPPPTTIQFPLNLNCNLHDQHHHHHHPHKQINEMDFFSDKTHDVEEEEDRSRLQPVSSSDPPPPVTELDFNINVRNYQINQINPYF